MKRSKTKTGSINLPLEFGVYCPCAKEFIPLRICEEGCNFFERIDPKGEGVLCEFTIKEMKTMSKFRVVWKIELEKEFDVASAEEARIKAEDIDCQHEGDYVDDSFEIMKVEEVKS